MNADDTIVAPASGLGRAAVAVVRISGQRCRTVLEATCGGVPPARRMSLRRLRHPATGETLDHPLVVWFPGPASFSGEDMAEIHTHGGRAVVAAVLRTLTEVPGCRLAEPGEFTRRAFVNGKLDLSAAEGLADLVEAETQAQRRQALRQMDGALATTVEAWREKLIAAVALVEASLDFSDEGDVTGDLVAQALREAAALRAAMARVLDDGRAGERLREGFTVVITGAPNAGKSTLLNALARRDVAIVSPVPGTTRDVIEVQCDLGGLPVVLVDTAGLRETTDFVEQEGVRRARARAESADLVLHLTPIDTPAERVQPPSRTPVIHVRTKADLIDSPNWRNGLAISALTGHGMDDLLAAIQSHAESSLGHTALITRERHRRAFLDTVAALERAVEAGSEAPPELVAEDLRLALRSLGRITGRVDVENVLDRLFASFCIGK